MLGRDRSLNFEVGSLPGGLGCAGPSLVMLGGGSKCSPRGTGFTGTTSEFPLLPPLWSPSGNSECFMNEAHVFILHWLLQITSNPHILLPLSSPPGPGNTRAASFFPGGRGSFPSSGLGLCLLRGTPPHPTRLLIFHHCLSPPPIHSRARRVQTAPGTERALHAHALSQ